MKREYQYNFSQLPAGQYNVAGREKKAKTMISVLREYIDNPLENLTLLDIGASVGIIDNYLASYFKLVIGIDLDYHAISQAKQLSNKKNLIFQVGDAMNLQFSNNTFDVVICSQVYEHVPNPEKMMREIHRVLKPGGVCYFAASNRFMLIEPHYNLPLLSVIPRPLAHLYVRLTKKADYYYELHYTYWGLKKLVESFKLIDYTEKLINNPIKYKIDYMLQPGSIKQKIVKLLIKFFPWISSGYIWLLEKQE